MLQAPLASPTTVMHHACIHECPSHPCDRPAGQHPASGASWPSPSCRSAPSPSTNHMHALTQAIPESAEATQRFRGLLASTANYSAATHKAL